MFLFRILFLFIALALISCNNEDDVDLPANFQGYTYLPLEIGQERIYQIDSISYDDFTGTVDTVIYFERQLIISSEIDLGGRINYKAEIFRRNADTLDWRLSSVELRYRGTLRYELNQGGNIFIPLVFPPLESSSWDVNSMNAQTEIIYEYQNLHQPYQLQGDLYDSSITVLQNDVLNLIERERDLEVYASGIGMIYKENIALETDIISGEIVRGFERRQYLIQP